MTKAQVAAYHPCAGRWRVLEPTLPDDEPLTMAEARAIGVTFHDLVWLAGSAARKDADVERRLRLWAADCAARVVHLVRDERSVAAVTAARAYARGEIGDAALAVARTAAVAARMATIIDDTTWLAAHAAETALETAENAWHAVGVAAYAVDAVWFSRWATGGAAVRAMEAAKAVEEAWQFDRLVARFSDDEPDDWPVWTQAGP